MEGMVSSPLDLEAQMLMVRTHLEIQGESPAISATTFIPGHSPGNQNLKQDGARYFVYL
jgi:hypothetical protein